MNFNLLLLVAFLWAAFVPIVTIAKSSAICASLLSSAGTDLRNYGQYRKVCKLGGTFFSINGKMENHVPKVEANCDHLVEQSFFVTEYLNKWRSFYKDLEIEEKNQFCGVFDISFEKLQFEINGQDNILRLDIRVHNFKNKLVNVADGKGNSIRLDGLVTEIFTKDELYLQKYMNKFIPTDGNLDPIRVFINGPVAKAVEHFKVKLLENQEEMENNIESDPLRKKIASSNIALQAIEKLEKRHSKLVAMVDQYEKHLQSAPRAFHPKIKGNKQAAFVGSYSGSPDIFFPTFEQYDHSKGNIVMDEASAPFLIIPLKSKIKSGNTKRKFSTLDREVTALQRARNPLRQKSINIEEAQNNIAHYLLDKNKKRFKGLPEFQWLEEELRRSIRGIHW